MKKLYSFKYMHYNAVSRNHVNDETIGHFHELVTYIPHSDLFIGYQHPEKIDELFDLCITTESFFESNIRYSDDCRSFCEYSDFAYSYVNSEYRNANTQLRHFRDDRSVWPWTIQKFY